MQPKDLTPRLFEVCSLVVYQFFSKSPVFTRASPLSMCVTEFIYCAHSTCEELVEINEGAECDDYRSKRRCHQSQATQTKSTTLRCTKHRTESRTNDNG